MAAKIYSGLEGLDAPKITFSDIKAYQKQCDKYIDDLKTQCKKYSDSDLAGEIIKFPVADGYALYMVLGVKPLELIHIDTMDGWHFDCAELLTVTKVRQLVERDKAMKELFS